MFVRELLVFLLSLTFLTDPGTIPAYISKIKYSRQTQRMALDYPRVTRMGVSHREVGLKKSKDQRMPPGIATSRVCSSIVKQRDKADQETGRQSAAQGYRQLYVLLSSLYIGIGGAFL